MPNDNSSGNDNVEATSLAEERNRLWRTFRFMVAIMIFYVVMIFLDYEHDTALLIVGAAAFLLWLLYMLAVIVMMVWADWSSSANLAHAEEQGLTSNGMAGQVDEATPNLADELNLIPFIKTKAFIRSNPDPKTPGVTPVNGCYDIIYNAIVFGKTLRSEARLFLSFQSASNGWSISGCSETVSGSRAISEGFVNSIGQMYWVINDERENSCMYRGILDFETCSMWDGEFESLGDANGVKGRIVRLQKSDVENEASRHKMTNADSEQSMEMVEIAKKGEGLV